MHIPIPLDEEQAVSFMIADFVEESGYRTFFDGNSYTIYKIYDAEAKRHICEMRIVRAEVRISGQIPDIDIIDLHDPHSFEDILSAINLRDYVAKSYE